MKLKLLPKFIISLCVVGLVFIVSVSLFGYLTSKRYLEELYAERVMTNSNTIASLLDKEAVKTIISEGGENTQEYKTMYNLFQALKKDGDITYLSLVVPGKDSVTFYIDAFVPEMGDKESAFLPYGAEIFYRDAANPDDPNDLEKYYEIWNAYKLNKGLDKPLVTDNKYGYNYTGISVVLDENGKAIAEVQYILDMSEVRSYLFSFLNNMILISFIISAVTMVAYIFFVRKMVTFPIGKLTSFTEEITKTKDFENQKIEINTGDEIEALSSSFNFMLLELEEYIKNLSIVTREKERIGTELDVARHIQRSMLPHAIPTLPCLNKIDIYATMTSAKEVGGDFYDYFLIDDDHLALVMADVSGKGVPAALFMAISKSLIKSALQSTLSPKEVLEKVNNQLCENNDAGMFVTVWLGILDIKSGVMKCANAGHEFPVVKRNNGKWELYKDKHGFVLAGMEASKYVEYELKFDKGDKLFVYTDGVPEATDGNLVLYGTKRMIDALDRTEGLSSRESLEYIQSDVNNFVGHVDQFDDITMMMLEIKDCPLIKEITVTPTPKCVESVTSFIEDILSDSGAPFKTIAQVNVAIDEILSNIISYSGAEKVTVKCASSLSEIKIEFSDDGKPYDPTSSPDPDTSLSVEERKLGGLGILMVKKIMDDITYMYKENKNILSIKKGW